MKPTIEDVMNFLIANSSPALPPQAIADVLDRLIWCLNDNGEELLVVRDKWLRGNEKNNVTIALAMNEVFPGKTKAEMERLFRQITKRWPDLQSTCQAVLDRWDEQSLHTSELQEDGSPLMRQ